MNPHEDDEISEIIDEAASAVEESAKMVHQCKKVIESCTEEEQRFRKEFEALCADLNPNNPLEADLLKQCEHEEKNMHI